MESVHLGRGRPSRALPPQTQPEAPSQAVLDVPSSLRFALRAPAEADATLLEAVTPTYSTHPMDRRLAEHDRFASDATSYGATGRVSAMEATRG